MKQRLEKNSAMFVQYMPQWWGGAVVEDPTKEYSKMENELLVQAGLLQTGNHAHE